jgi:hypothetical protein
MQAGTGQAVESMTAAGFQQARELEVGGIPKPGYEFYGFS